MYFKSLKKAIVSFFIITYALSSFAQSNHDDYWFNHPTNPFTSGQTIITNSGYFYDDGGFDLYGVGQDWSVRFCSENGNPITFDFNGFRTDYRGTFPNPPSGAYLSYDYLSVRYNPGASWVIFNDDTPQFSFTSPDGCMDFNFISQLTSLQDSGWVAEISALPPPDNNDPCTAAQLAVGNICSPSYFTNKGAYNTTNLGSPPCKTYFGGDVWFTAVVPPSGDLKIETIPGTLTYGIMVLYTGACNNLSYVSCVDILNSMPSVIYSGTPGTTVTIRIFGEQAKSGTFGICATDPNAPVTGYVGPGGVGDSISNTIWLRADNGALNDTDNPANEIDDVKTWKDLSGNFNHLEQSVPANRPAYLTNRINSMPALRFDGNDDYFYSLLLPQSAPVNIFSVNTFLEPGTDQSVISLGDALDDFTLSLARETDGRYYSFTGAKRYGPDISGTDARILYARHLVNDPYHQLSVNSVNQSVDNYDGPVATNGAFNIGASRDLDGFLNGEIGEIIIYNKPLNLAQEIIVHNYLAAKYAIDIGGTNRYAFSATHRYDVAGIGRVDAGNIHTRAQSAGIIDIGGASDLKNNDFLLFGHDGGDINTWLTVNVPGDDENLRRLERTWRVNITGSEGPGSVSITLNDSLLPPFEDGFISFNLLVSSNDDFAENGVAYGLIQSGDELTANNITLSNGDYITIASVKPFVSFTYPESEGFENIPNPQIEVSVNYAISLPFEVDYDIVEGTATRGVDYNLNPGKLVFNPGQKTQNIVPLIIDDDIVEIPDEYFIIGLFNPTGGVLPGTINQHKYTILNNDIDIEFYPADPVIGACLSSVDTIQVTATGTGPFTYSWSPADGLSDPEGSVTAVRPSETQTYILTVTDANGFTETDSVTVTVAPIPDRPEILPSGTLNITYGDSILLSSSEAIAYLWSTGDTTQSVYVKTEGEYYLSVLDGFGCESENSDTVVINLSSKQITITADPGQTKIYGEDDPELTYTITEGALLEGDTLTGSLNRLPGEDVGNYTIGQGSLTAGPLYEIVFVPADFEITARQLTVSGITANDKVYDGTTVATLNTDSYTFTGLSGSDDIALDISSYTAYFDTKDSGTDKPVTVEGLALSGTHSGNYTLAQPLGLTADITPLAITVSGISANNKEYDGTVTAVLSFTGYQLDGLINPDVVLLDTGFYSASFETRNAGTDIPVTVTGLILSGEDAINYSLDQPLGLMADITPREVSVTGITANDKVYDGTDIASLNLDNYNLTDVVEPDVLSLLTLSYIAVFDSKNVGTDIPVTVTNLQLDGEDAGNYLLKQPEGLMADITALAISVTGITANDKVYDGNNIASLTLGGHVVNGIIGTDQVSLDASYEAFFDNKNVGENKPVTVSELSLTGEDAGNYSLEQPSGLTADITPLEVSVSQITANNKVYDGNDLATLSWESYLISGIIDGDNISLDPASYIARFDSRNVGQDKPVEVTGMVLAGSDAGNYSLAQPAGLTADITPLELGISGITANNKVYDGTVSATLTLDGYVFSNLIGSDNVVLDPASYIAEFDSKDVGTDIPVTVTGLEISGTDALNYLLLQPTDLSADILAAELTVSGISANDRVYDGTTIAFVTTDTYVLNGLISPDNVVLESGTYVASFDSKHAGTDKPVTISGLLLSGPDAGNYLLIQPVSSTATIHQRPLNLFNFTADDKLFDGTVSVNGASFDDDRIPGDDLEFSFDASFTDPAVGENKEVLFTGISISGGADMGNYQLAVTSGTALASILPCEIQPVTISVIGSTDLCEGDSTVLSAGMAHSYLWSTGDTSMNITVKNAGIYSVRVMNADGCSSGDSEAVQISVHPNPVLSFTKADVSCYGGADGSIASTVTGGTSPYAYLWSTGDNTANIGSLNSGNYSLTVTDANSCKADGSVMVQQPSQIIIEESVEPAYCSDSEDGIISVNVSGGVSPYLYNWADGPTGHYRGNLLHGVYSLTVTDANLCEVSVDINVPFTRDICFLIPEIITPNDDGWNDEWIIEGLHAYPNATVEIYNRWGQRVFYSRGYEIPFDGTHSGNELPMDSYHYIINLHNGSKPIIGNITIIR